MTLAHYSHVSTDLQRAAVESIPQRLLELLPDTTTYGSDTEK